MSVGGN